MNNSGGSLNQPNDILFRDLLNYFNSVFQSGNIHFSTGNECVHVGTTDPSLVAKPTSSNPNSVYSHFFDSNGQPVNDPDFGYDPNALNIYIFQVQLFQGGATVQHPDPMKLFNVVYGIPDQTTLAHEIGHALGMKHTYDAFSNSNDPLLPENQWECKHNSVNSNWATTGDRLEDTGPDPWLMDLDGIGQPDNHKWVTGCKVNIPNTIKDKCDSNNDELWNIPFDNIMSAYQASCKVRFSPCQLRVASDYLSTSDGAALTLDCSIDPSFQTCADITISTPTVWSNLVKEMCKDQKIIISGTGTLIVDNSKITSKILNSNCPDLKGNWDGIYIEDPVVNSGPFLPPFPPPSTSVVNLSIINNSIMEYSNSGIQAPNGNGGICIFDSKLRENQMAIYAAQGSASSSDLILIGNSEITNTAINPKEVMIKVFGVDLYIDQSILKHKKLESNSRTCIKSMDNFVNISNITEINGFGIGIDNNVGGSSGQMGLNIYDSRIDCQIESIRNTDGFINAEYNFIRGDVNNYGISFGHWRGNNFQSDINLINPTESQTIEENRFHQKQLYLQGDQSLTDARCNSWRAPLPFNTAVSGSSIPRIMSEWGTVDIASGNIHVNSGSAPIMTLTAGNQIANWHRTNLLNTVFNYQGDFEQNRNASNNHSCEHDVFPSSFTSGSGTQVANPYSDSYNNSIWQNCNTEYSNLSTQIANASPEATPALIAARERTEVCMGQAALRAIIHLDANQNASSYTTWLSRTDPIILQRSQILSLLKSNELEDLILYLNSLNPSISNVDDLDNFIVAIEWMKTAQDNNKDIRNLSIEDQSTLADMARISYGDYTEVLRSFMNIVYDIKIDHPILYNSNLVQSKSTIPSAVSASMNAEIIDERCIGLRISETMDERYCIKIYNTQGQAVHSSVLSDLSRYCIEVDLLPGIYFFQVLNSQENIIQYSKLYIK
ncbi:MAG: hypothetical protein IT267_07940 [Saprospiraceae bacterium]|nr:hypothetical protein [Saprospiraceae bacterium]